MRHIIGVMQRGRVAGASVESAQRARQLFQYGLEYNRSGLTLRACELFQRAALGWKIGFTPTHPLNVLISLANMHVKLGMPAPALLAYAYVLEAEGASERHLGMARRKQTEALLLEEAAHDAPVIEQAPPPVVATRYGPQLW